MNETADKLARLGGRATAGIGPKLGLGSAWWPFGTDDAAPAAATPPTATVTDDYVQHIALLLKAQDFESAVNALSQLSKADVAAITPRLIALGVPAEDVNGLVINGETINVQGTAPAIMTPAGWPWWYYALGAAGIFGLVWFLHNKRTTTKAAIS